MYSVLPSMKFLEIHFIPSSMRMTGNEILRTIIHSARLRGQIWKTICEAGKFKCFDTFYYNEGLLLKMVEIKIYSRLFQTIQLQTVYDGSRTGHFVNRKRHFEDMLRF